MEVESTETIDLESVRMEMRENRRRYRDLFEAICEEHAKLLKLQRRYAELRMLVLIEEARRRGSNSKMSRFPSLAFPLDPKTHAIRHALRAPLGQIVVLAGYEATGADEIAVIEAEPAATAEAAASTADPRLPTREKDKP